MALFTIGIRSVQVREAQSGPLSLPAIRILFYLAVPRRDSPAAPHTFLAVCFPPRSVTRLIILLLWLATELIFLSLGLDLADERLDLGEDLVVEAVIVATVGRNRRGLSVESFWGKAVCVHVKLRVE